MTAAKSATFTYSARRPFDPLRLYCLLHTPWPADVTASGCFWIATRPDWMAEVECIGGAVRHRACCVWWCSLPSRTTSRSFLHRASLTVRWHPVFGDRRQEIVFSGPGIDAATIRRVFDDCLVEGSDKVDEWNPEWSLLPDPFPQWEQSRPVWCQARGQSMIPKSGNRFSEKIMLKQKARARF